MTTKPPPAGGTKRVAVILFWAFALVWFAAVAISMGIQATQYGHGWGIGDGVRNAGNQLLVRGQLDGVGAGVVETSLWGDAWRLALTATLCLGLIGFWHVVGSRLGDFGAPGEVETIEVREFRTEPYRRFFVSVSIAGTFLLLLSAFAVPYVVLRYGWGAP